MGSVKSAPPAFRDVGVREISGALPAPRQVGYSPPMNTDACLRQSSEVAYASRDVSGSALARMAVQTSKGRSGNMEDLARKAEVGYFACLAAVAPVALPPSVALAADDALKASGVYLCKEFRPLEPELGSALVRLSLWLPFRVMGLGCFLHFYGCPGSPITGSCACQPLEFSHSEGRKGAPSSIL